MFEQLLLVTGVVCIFSVVFAWRHYRDVFHPVVLIGLMFFFMYVYMPYQLSQDDRTFTYLSTEQMVLYQAVLLASITAFVAGCCLGSSGRRRDRRAPADVVDPRRIRSYGYILGFIGFLAWVYTIQNAGGFLYVFSSAKGMGWSDFGYVRDASALACR